MFGSRSRWPAVLVAVLAAAMAPAAATAALRLQEGLARDPASGRELYMEQHFLRSEDDRLVERLVLYRCTDGTAFARKRVDYRRSQTTPAFRLDDARNGYREGMSESVPARLFVRASAASVERSAPVASARLVADAGFDAFVRQHWSALVAGQAVPLDFAVPARLRSMAFQLHRVGETVVAGEPAWIFRLRLDGWLGWLAPAIDVFYGQASRRLLRFQGLSNLRDDEGDGQLVARIDFPQAPAPVPEGQWQAAADTPLSACRTGR